MQLIAAHPIQAEAIHPYCGRRVIAMTVNGDLFSGQLDRIEDGLCYFTPYQGAHAMVSQMKKSVLAHPKTRKYQSKRKKSKPLGLSATASNKVRTKAWGLGGFGYPGYGYPGWGWGWGLGAALAFTLPLFLLGALFLI